MKLTMKMALASVLFAFTAAASFSAAAADTSLADRHVAKGLKCEMCHGQKDKDGKFEFEAPEKEQCVQCHDAKKVSEKTKNVKPSNPHDSPHYHQDLECTLCHLGHDKPEIYCNQCHKFDYKMP